MHKAVVGEGGMAELSGVGGTTHSKYRYISGSKMCDVSLPSHGHHGHLRPQICRSPLPLRPPLPPVELGWVVGSPVSMQ